MARLPRVVMVDVPHHVTQRGNDRRAIFENDSDRLTYLGLLRQHCEVYRLSVLGYCLMSNHVHLIAVPRAILSLAQALKHTHGRYAAYWNARRSSSGHVWQGRFYSCPLDDSHLWRALRYVELNPVRAGLVDVASRWRWSSAAAHCGAATPENWLELELWRKRWTAEEWTDWLGKSQEADEATVLRHFTHTGRPLGSPEFVADLERSMLRELAPPDEVDDRALWRRPTNRRRRLSPNRN